MQKVTVRVPGSCGELVQGSIAGQDFLISAPINLYTRITAALMDYQTTNKKIAISQPAPKAEAAARKVLDYYNYQQKSIKLELNSQLEQGVGMASSTADISAAAAAVMLLLNKKVDLKLLKKICLSIEPTDSVFLKGLRVFDHLQGKKDCFIAEAPEIDILIFKEKGKIDSLNFNKSKKLSALNNLKSKQVKKAVELVKKGLKNKDYSLLAKGSTLSAFAHQDILFKKNLTKLLEIINNRTNLYGLNIAHSGTLIGILTASSFSELEFNNLSKKIAKKTDLKYMQRVKFISGGIERMVFDGKSAPTWRKIKENSFKI